MKVNVQQAFAKNSANVQVIDERVEMSEEQKAIIARNIVLRNLISTLEHNQTLTSEQEQQLSNILSSKENFLSCEKGYYELIAVMYQHSDLMEKAEEIEELLKAHSN